MREIKWRKTEKQFSTLILNCQRLCKLLRLRIFCNGIFDAILSKLPFKNFPPKTPIRSILRFFPLNIFLYDLPRDQNVRFKMFPFPRHVKTYCQSSNIFPTLNPSPKNKSELALKFFFGKRFFLVFSLTRFFNRLGRPGVDAHLKHDGEGAVIQIQFLTNEGALITATSDDVVHLWNFRQKKPEVVHSLKFQRER